MANSDYAGENKERYKVLSGGSHEAHGEIMYGIVTGEGDGTVHYEDGREVTVAKGGSLEILGQNLKVGSKSENPINPAKLIRAEKGDIIIEAKNGKIILMGTQVEIRASGNKKDKTGSIYMNANVSVQVNSPDTRISGTKCTIAAAHTLNVVGKNYIDMVSSFSSASTSTDLLSTNIFQQVSSIHKKLLSFK